MAMAAQVARDNTLELDGISSGVQAVIDGKLSATVDTLHIEWDTKQLQQ